MYSDAHTASGLPVVFEVPGMTPIVGYDLRTQLGNICRYNGAHRVNLLAHSVLTASIASMMGYNDKAVAHCAMHDFCEAYLGDINPNLKTEAYKKLEIKWSIWIDHSLGIKPPQFADEVAIKRCDRAALLAEMHAVAHPSSLWPTEKWEAYGGKPDFHADYVSEAEACIYDRSNASHWETLSAIIQAAGGSIPGLGSS